jgi:hydroxymethylglutaryl-CoA lyase
VITLIRKWLPTSLDGFGNPYGDPWNVDIVGEWIEKMSNMGVKILSLSQDTRRKLNTRVISYLFSNLIPKYPEIEFGVIYTQHLTGLKN